MQEETVTSTVADIIPDEYLAHTFGIDYTNKGLFLLAEYMHGGFHTDPHDQHEAGGPIPVADRPRDDRQPGTDEPVAGV